MVCSACVRLKYKASQKTPPVWVLKLTSLLNQLNLLSLPKLTGMQ